MACVINTLCLYKYKGKTVTFDISALNFDEITFNFRSEWNFATMMYYCPLLSHLLLFLSSQSDRPQG